MTEYLVGAMISPVSKKACEKKVEGETEKDGIWRLNDRRVQSSSATIL